MAACGAEGARCGLPISACGAGLLATPSLATLPSCCTQALRRADEFATTAREWSSLGNRLYTAQIVAAASVPVRIGLRGSVT